MNLPHFDALYSVSDLHLGGDHGFQIFREGNHLAATIRRLREASPARRVALVLNGDVVDFLAERPRHYLDPQGAVNKLHRIYRDPSFQPVWEALAAFIATPNHQLIVVLGNHDVELALPAVQEWLSSALSGGNVDTAGRLRFCTDGIGFACRVGEKRVLCLHGNETDDWNVVDYHALMQLKRRLNRGTRPEEWDANGGTRLVIDVMNDIKERYPMVDLLKPETDAALPILATMELPLSKLETIGRLLRALKTRSRDADRLKSGFLADEEQVLAAEGEAPPPALESLNQLLTETMGGQPTAQADDGALVAAYRAVEQRERGELSPAKGADDPEHQLLGIGDWITALFNEEKRREILRNALGEWLAKRLDGDNSFQVGAPNDADHALMGLVGAEVDYLMAGHSHLRRAARRPGGGYYYNTGTWIRLIRLPPSSLKDETAFAELYRALHASTMTDLDRQKLPNGDDLVFTQPTVACIERLDGVTRGRLCSAEPDGTLTTIDGTEF